MAALNQLKLHGSPGAQRTIALSRQRRKVEEHPVACPLSGEHANTCFQIEPAQHSACNWRTVSIHRWNTSSPYLLGNAHLSHFRCGVRSIRATSPVRPPDRCRKVGDLFLEPDTQEAAKSRSPQPRVAARSCLQDQTERAKRRAKERELLITV